MSFAIRLTIAAGLAALTACAAQGSTVDTSTPQTLAGQLPLVTSLDGLRDAAEVGYYDVDCGDPYAALGVLRDGAILHMYGTSDDIAYAVYRVIQPAGTPVTVECGGSEVLWVLAADYSAQRWSWAQPFTGGQTQLDLSALGDATSPEGNVYVAVLCPPAQEGTLTQMRLLYDGTPDYNLVATPDEERGAIVLTWDQGLAAAYEVLRSTMPDDPWPRHVAMVAESYPAQNTWTEFVATDPADGTWVAKEDTEGWPWIAPGVDYYYWISPVYTARQPSATLELGPAAHAMLPWGSRRSVRRELPDVTSQTLVFADQLLPDDMSSQQVQWCAENLVGTQKIFKGQADEFRAWNPDFLVLGYHLGVGAGEIGNVSGLSWDSDADWLHLSLHDGWFITVEGSSQPQQRAVQQDWNWFLTDPASGWQDYLAGSLLEMLGENHFDGWFVDSCSEPWNTDPAQWWPGANDSAAMFAYFTPRLSSMLKEVTTLAKAHPLQPYIIPNAGNYVTTLSDIRYYGADWACDGIMVEGYGHWSPGSYYSEADWTLQQDRILDHQAHGLATILQSSIFTPDQQDQLFVFASYLLVRDVHTYINWLGDDGLDTIWSNLPQWYPEFDAAVDLAPPPAPPAANAAAMLEGGLYKRQFGMGFVLVNPGDAAAQYDIPYHMQKLAVSGGGNVTSDGATQGSYSWEIIEDVQTLPAHSALIILDILD